MRLLIKIGRKKLTDAEKKSGIEQLISTVEADKSTEPKIRSIDRQAEKTTPLPKEESRRKRTKTLDFETLFLRDQPITARLGMSAYIRTKYHKRITKIISVIGGNSLTISSYIDNVLEQHFATYQDEIDELYNKNVKGVFDDET